MSYRSQEIDRLTVRELVIIQVLVENAATSKEVAVVLGIAQSTVTKHISSIYEKLNIHNQMELVLYALANDIVDVNKILAKYRKTPETP
jgi:DNA-binding CsgD family transcriptional regulator